MKDSRKENYVLTKEHKRCLKILGKTNRNLFITGRAGTGKSFLIQYFRDHTQKKVVVLAPTGRAALNIRGQTIHSFFGFPPRMIELKAIRQYPPKKFFRDVDTLIIDEVSMVRGDLWDGMEKYMRLNGRDDRYPFGGAQVVIVGDLFQLPPVVTEEEVGLYYQRYETPYFFSANSFHLEAFVVVELTLNFRQKERDYVDFLNQVRQGEVTIDSLSLVNTRVTLKKPDDNYLILTPINRVADKINAEKLTAIPEPIFTYQGRIEGNFPTENWLPVDLELKLKKGAQVVFVKNDPGGQWVNGTLGIVDFLDEETIKVRIDKTGKRVKVHIETWDNIEYVEDETGYLNERVVGTLKQYPLRLAWAVTIHKSQGMSLDKVCLDFSFPSFAHGQTYVALSRCRTLAGLILTKRIWPNDILIDPQITEFYRRIRQGKI